MLLSTVFKFSSMFGYISYMLLGIFFLSTSSFTLSYLLIRENVYLLMMMEDILFAHSLNPPHLRTPAGTRQPLAKTSIHSPG